MDRQFNKGENPDQPDQSKEQCYRGGRHSSRGHLFGGLVLVAVGGLLLARQMGVELPWWLFTWPMLLIAIGIYIGARHSFKTWGWLIPVAIGVVFFVDNFVEEISLKLYFWPLLIIIIGMVMIFRPRRSRHDLESKDWGRKTDTDTQQSSDEYLDNVTVFGGVKKNIITKNFKGGEIVTILGGTELNLTQADISDKIVLDLVQIFGGTKLIVPAHWRITTDELVCIFGGMDDKRPLPAPASTDSTKVLVIKGTCIFGGIDIKSY